MKGDATDLAVEVATWLGKLLKAEIDPKCHDALLVQDYNATSMDLVDIAETIEKKYGVTITNDQIPGIRTFGDLIRLIPNDSYD